ncbi:MAG: TonB-dependent receptor [Muribaculaceae bacterium]|nr:TonB-dependent receptor [Muribaculaceae bacterium]
MAMASSHHIYNKEYRRDSNLHKSYFTTVVRTLTLCMAIVCSLTMTVNASAGTPPNKASQTVPLDTATMLNEVVVTAERRPLATEQSLEGPQLQALSTTSIADALKYFAGVQIKDYGGLGGMKTVNVRSLGAQHVGVYIDGIRVTNAQNGTVDLGKFSLSTLESVSLYNANKLDRCQSASEFASGATVYLRTRRPDTDSLSVMGSIGSFHTYRGRLTLQMNRKGWAGFIDGEYLNSRGDYKFRYKSEYEDTVGIRQNSDIDYYRIEGALFKNGFSSHVYCYVSERGVPGGIVRRLSDKYVNVGREWDADWFAQASWAHSFSSTHQVMFNAKYTQEYLRYCTDYPENQNTARVNNHYWQKDVYGSASYAFTPLEWLSVNAGYDARHSWLKADLRNFHTVRRLDQKAVVALQAEYANIRLAASMLYQHYKDHTYTKAGAADPLSKFTPSVTLGYTIGSFSFRAWYKKIFRAPTLNDLYYTQVGNRNLKPEYTRQFDLGIEYHYYNAHWSASAQVDGYINNIDNRIVCLPLKGTYSWSMMNYGKTYCRGLNANLSGRFAPTEDWNFSLLTSITWQRDVNRTDPQSQSYNQPICYSPTLSLGVTGVIGWRMITLSISDLHVGKRMWSYADPEDILKPYNNVDMKLTGKWRWFTASLEINDLFDEQYEHVPRYPMPGRSFTFSLTYSL